MYILKDLRRIWRQNTSAFGVSYLLIIIKNHFVAVNFFRCAVEIFLTQPIKIISETSGQVFNQLVIRFRLHVQYLG